MANKKTRTIDKLSLKDAGKGMEHLSIMVVNNLSVLDLWNEYIEKNKMLYKLEDELQVNSILEDIHYKKVPFLQL